jgi:hypothetical protein
LVIFIAKTEGLYLFGGSGQEVVVRSTTTGITDSSTGSVADLYRRSLVSD